MLASGNVAAPSTTNYLLTNLTKMNDGFNILLIIIMKHCVCVEGRIRIREKVLFFASAGLVIMDTCASLYVFVQFVTTRCFGYESEEELSDYLNIIYSILLKVCCVNVLMQEVTNTLPGIIQLPFFIQTVIMGIVPNL